MRINMDRKILASLFISLLIVAVMSGCSNEPSAGGKVLVKVSNSFITVKDFTSRLSKLPEYYKKMVEKDKKRYLEEMISEKLLYEEAIRRGLNRDKEVVDVLNEAKRKIVITRLVKDEVDNKAKVGEDEMLAFYEANKDKLTTPEMWKVSQILVPTEDEAKAILQELNSGGDFAELARARSKDATAERGGDVGYFTTGQVIPDFEKAAIKLDVGQTSDIVHTKFGYHIIRMTDRKPPEIQSFEKAKPLIESELRKKKKADVFYDLVMSLKKKYGVEIDEVAFEEMEASDKTAESVGDR